MNERDLISCFELEKDDYSFSLESALRELLAIPDTFTALAWQFDYDFLYMSPSVTNVLGYPVSNFRSRGVLFLHSITPPEQIEPLYNSLTRQMGAMEEEPGYISHPILITTKTKINHQDGRTMDAYFTALPVDYRPGEKNAYLVLGTNFLPGDKSEVEISQTCEQIKGLMIRIKENYVRANPKRFRYLEALSSVTKRELEVAELLCQGLNTRRIAEKLFISHNTVDTHRKNLLSKFESKNTAELIHQLSALIDSQR